MAREKPVRFYTSEENRRRIKALADSEGLTYEELVLALIEFRDNHEELWDNRDSDTVRRPSGSGGSG